MPDTKVPVMPPLCVGKVENFVVVAIVDKGGNIRSEGGNSRFQRWQPDSEGGNYCHSRLLLISMTPHLSGADWDTSTTKNQPQIQQGP